MIIIKIILWKERKIKFLIAEKYCSDLFSSSLFNISLYLLIFGICVWLWESVFSSILLSSFSSSEKLLGSSTFSFFSLIILFNNFSFFDGCWSDWWFFSILFCCSPFSILFLNSLNDQISTSKLYFMHFLCSSYSTVDNLWDISFIFKFKFLNCILFNLSLDLPILFFL